MVNENTHQTHATVWLGRCGPVVEPLEMALSLLVNLFDDGPDLSGRAGLN